LGKHPLSGQNEVADILEVLEKLCAVRLDERGRIYLPKIVREQLQIKLGEKIYLQIESDHFSVYTKRALKKRIMQT